MTIERTKAQTRLRNLARDRRDRSQDAPAPCGCVNRIDGQIEFCALHAAAPALLEVCETMARVLPTAGLTVLADRAAEAVKKARPA